MRRNLRAQAQRSSTMNILARVDHSQRASHSGPGKLSTTTACSAASSAFSRAGNWNWSSEWTATQAKSLTQAT